MYKMLNGETFTIEKVCIYFDSRLIEVNGERDHVHLLIQWFLYLRRYGLGRKKYFPFSSGIKLI